MFGNDAVACRDFTTNGGKQWMKTIRLFNNDTAFGKVAFDSNQQVGAVASCARSPHRAVLVVSLSRACVYLLSYTPQNGARRYLVTQLLSNRYFDASSIRSVLVLPTSAAKDSLVFPAPGTGARLCSWA